MLFLSFWTADLWDGSRPLSSLSRANQGPDADAESAHCAASNKTFHGEVAVQHEARGAHIQQLQTDLFASILHHLKWFQITNSPEMILFSSPCRHDPDRLLSVIPLTFLWLFKPMVSIQYHFPLCQKEKQQILLFYVLFDTRLWGYEDLVIDKHQHYFLYIGWGVAASFSHCPTRTCKFSMNGIFVLGETTTPLLTCVCLTSEHQSIN